MYCGYTSILDLPTDIEIYFFFLMLQWLIFLATDYNLRTRRVIFEIAKRDAFIEMPNVILRRHKV